MICESLFILKVSEFCITYIILIWSSFFLFPYRFRMWVNRQWWWSMSIKHSSPVSVYFVSGPEFGKLSLLVILNNFCFLEFLYSFLVHSLSLFVLLLTSNSLVIGYEVARAATCSTWHEHEEDRLSNSLIHSLCSCA